MLDPRDWKVIFEVYAREPTLALALAYQFIALKQSLQRGPKGIPDALAGLNQAIDSLYPHTDFHKMARRLYYRTIESTITFKQEDLITALKKSLHQPKRKPIVKAEVQRNTNLNSRWLRRSKKPNPSKSEKRLRLQMNKSPLSHRNAQLTNIQNN